MAFLGSLLYILLGLGALALLGALAWFSIRDRGPTRSSDGDAPDREERVP